MAGPITASNALTRRWAATCGDTSTVLSGLGVWPLIALLAAGAAGPAAVELRRAAGSDAGTGSVTQLLDTLTSSRAIHAAVGLWTDRDLPLERQWLDSLPAQAHQVFTGDRVADKAALDAWAAKNTDDLIRQLPVTLSPDVLLVLASALAVRTSWPKHFSNGRHTTGIGPWAGTPYAGLSRSSTDLAQVSVIDDITRARIAGDNDIEVQLLLGATDRPAGEVLAAGIDALETDPGSTGADWQTGQSGPGVEVTHSPHLDEPTLRVNLARFTIDAAHNLLDNAELFGLAAARRGGGFPGISAQPLAISQARQNAMATFSATGFEAAAVTAMAMRASGVRRMRGATLVSVAFDRPFGFLAVHQPTNLVLAAGWVADPEPWQEFQDDDS